MSPTATSSDVLKRDIPWETYMTAKLINSTDLQLLRRYDRRPESVQAALLDENGPAYMRVFLSLVRNISKEETVEYVLAVIDELLSANPKRARLFHSQEFENEDVYQPFSRLLSKNNWFMEEKASKILTLAISSRPRDDTSTKTKHFQDVIQSVVNWLCAQLRHPSHPTRAIPTAVSCLAALLREPGIRTLFVQSDGVKLIAPLISPASSQQYIQLLYEATLCMWLLSYHDDAVETITNTRAIPRLVEVVRTTSKEKVVRVAILTLKNLVTRQNLAADMVEAGLDKAIYNLRQLAWSDEDLTQALDALETSLKDSIKQLSSFEKYKQEVLSGNLDWTPMHKDASFWKENIHKFEENDYQILRILVTILDTSRDPKTLAVACHDLSSFIQNHPAGRGILQDLRVKDRVMKLMSHENSEVAREALLCVQKILLSAKYLSFIQ